MGSTADTDIADEELVRRYRDTGSRPHLDALLERHIGRVRSLAYGMVLNHSDADDLTQEVFLRVTKSLAQFKGDSKFSTWLYRVTVNASTRFLECRGRLPVEIDRRTKEPLERAAQGPEYRVLSGETAQAVADALATLTPALRAAMVLVVLEGVSVEEAAEVEGCTASTIYWRIHEGRKILRQRLAGYLIRVAQGEIRDLGTVELLPALKATVSVVDATGAVVEGARVARVYKGGFANTWRTTDAAGQVSVFLNRNSTGRFEVTLPPSKAVSRPANPVVAFEVGEQVPAEVYELVLSDAQFRLVRSGSAKTP